MVLPRGEACAWAPRHRPRRGKGVASPDPTVTRRRSPVQPARVPFGAGCPGRDGLVSVGRAGLLWTADRSPARPRCRMLGLAAPTPYDLRFRLLDIPVRVNPLFWLVMA